MLKYQKDLDGAMQLSITEDNKATVSAIDLETVTVQLASDEEATKMIAEFEDKNGDMMHEEGAIFSKYPELAAFLP